MEEFLTNLCIDILPIKKINDFTQIKMSKLNADLVLECIDNIFFVIVSLNCVKGQISQAMKFQSRKLFFFFIPICESRKCVQANFLVRLELGCRLVCLVQVPSHQTFTLPNDKNIETACNELSTV